MFTPPDPDPLLNSDGLRLQSLAELRRIRWLLVVLSLMAGTLAFYFAKDVLLPTILGLMMALTLSPIVRTAKRVGLPPPLTAFVLIFGIAGVLVVGGYAMSGPVSNWMENLPQMAREVQFKLRGLFQSVERVQEAASQAEEMAQGSGEVQRVALEQPGLLNSAASYAAAIATTTGVALILALFILGSGDMFYSKLVESYARMSDKKRALKIVFGVERAISRYLLTITVINASLGAVVFALMLAVGMENPLIWGVVAFAFNFLPFIGAVAGTMLVGFVAILTFDTVGQAMLAPLLFYGATAIEGQFVTPTILGRSLKMNTVSVFVTVVFWGWLWGIAGALMAVPFLVVVKVVCDNISAMKTLGNFIGGADTRIDATREAEEAAKVDAA